MEDAYRHCGRNVIVVLDNLHLCNLHHGKDSDDEVEEISHDSSFPEGQMVEDGDILENETRLGQGGQDELAVTSDEKI